MSMWNKILKMKEKLVVFPFIFLLILSPFLLKTIGVHERFSSPISIVVNFLLLLASYIIYKKQEEFEDFYTIFMCNLLALIVTLFFYSGSGAAITYINMILMINLFNNLRLSKYQGVLLHGAISIYLAFWLLSIDTSQVANAYMEDPSGLYINPCTFGILSLAFYFHTTICVNFLLEDKKVERIVLNVLLFAVALYLVDLSRCRASLLALLAFGGLQFFKDFIKKHYRGVLLGALATSLIFPLVYLAIYQMGGTFEFLGKSFFTGRQLLWDSTIDLITKSPILGSGTNIEIYYKDNIYYDEPHNLFLGIWKSLGLLPVITLFILFISGKNVDKVDKTNVLAKIMFVACLVISTVETVLNGSEYYLFFLPLLLTYKMKARTVSGKEGFVCQSLYTNEDEEVDDGRIL